MEPGSTLIIRSTGDIVYGRSVTQLHVYPNPGTQSVHVALADAPTGVRWQYRLLSLYGQAVRTGQIPDARLGVELLGVPAGQYLLGATAADGRQRLSKRLEIR